MEVLVKTGEWNMAVNQWVGLVEALEREGRKVGRVERVSARSFRIIPDQTPQPDDRRGKEEDDDNDNDNSLPSPSRPIPAILTQIAEGGEEGDVKAMADALLPTHTESALRGVVVPVDDVLQVIGLDRTRLLSSVANVLGAPTSRSISRFELPSGLVGFVAVSQEGDGEEGDGRRENSHVTAMLDAAGVEFGHRVMGDVVLVLEEPRLEGETYTSPTISPAAPGVDEESIRSVLLPQVVEALERAGRSAGGAAHEGSSGEVLRSFGLDQAWMGSLRAMLSNPRDRMMLLMDAVADAVGHVYSALTWDAWSEEDLALDTVAFFKTLFTRNEPSVFWTITVKVLLLLRSHDPDWLTTRELLPSHSLRKHMIDLAFLRAVESSIGVRLTPAGRMAIISRAEDTLTPSHFAHIPGVALPLSTSPPPSVPSPSSPPPSSPPPSSSSSDEQSGEEEEEWDMVSGEEASIGARCWEPLNVALQDVLRANDMGADGFVLIDSDNPHVPGLVAAIARVLLHGVRKSKLEGVSSRFGSLGAKLGSKMSASSQRKAVISALTASSPLMANCLHGIRSMGFPKEHTLTILIRMCLAQKTLPRVLIQVYGLGDPMERVQGERESVLRKTYGEDAMLCCDESRDLFLEFLRSLEPVIFAIGIQSE